MISPGLICVIPEVEPVSLLVTVDVKVGQVADNLYNDHTVIINSCSYSVIGTSTS